MNFLFTSQPGFGHLRGLLALARGLRGAGHTVAFASASPLGAEVQREGFEFFSVGPPWELNTGAGALFPGCPPPGPASKLFTLREVFARLTARQTFPDLLEVIARFAPAVVIRESEEYGGLLAAEALGLPHASVAVGAESSTLQMARVVERTIEEVGAELRLPHRVGFETLHKYLHLCGLPAEFDGPLELFSDTTHFVRFDRARPPRPAGLAHRPLVLASMGTMFHLWPGIFEALFTALAGAPVDVVFAVGKDRDLGELGSAPNVRVEAFVDQVALLDSCSGFITHGGFNSIKEAIAAGVPVLAIPLAADQPYVAQRCAALGVGQVLSASPLEPALVRTALAQVLEQPSFRSNMQQLTAALNHLPGPERAVELLEELGTARAPLRRTAGAS